MPSAAKARFEIFAATAPGLESIAAGELKSLGIRGKQEPGGVSFAGGVDELYRANLWLRTATRVLVRLGAFHASTFYELERRVRKLGWEDFLPSAGSVAVRATCRKSRLYHSDAVAERVLAAIARVAPAGVSIEAVVAPAGVSIEAVGSSAKKPIDAEDLVDREDPVDAEGSADDVGDVQTVAATTASVGSRETSQLFIVRIVHDHVEISADSSGELLHRRGYRREVAKAPLRETLAAAMLLASGWQKNETLIDPLCGSGPIPIEAAMMARKMAPGLRRAFQFARWPGFVSGRWDSILTEAREMVTDPALNITGGDRDSGAIEAAVRNAERAGVASDIVFATGSLSDSLARLRESGAERAWLLMNPPYGVRVGDERELRDLYAAIGNAVVEHPGWRVGMLTADKVLAGQLRLSLRSRFDSRNGGIPVSFLVSGKGG